MTDELELTRPAFAPHVGTAFTLAPPARPVAFELVAVDALGSGPADDASFSLRFRTALAERLPQATYVFDHEAMGLLAIFVVPIRQDAEGVYYEAVFNRQTPRPAA